MSDLYAGYSVSDIDGIDRPMWVRAPKQATRLYTWRGVEFYTSTGPIFAVRAPRADD